jgi:hypothetical protein
LHGGVIRKNLLLAAGSHDKGGSYSGAAEN